MASSTSSSEPGAGLLAASARLARASAPSCVAAALFVGLAFAAIGGRPAEPAWELEGTIIGVQLARAPRIDAPDVLVIGDSSAAMDVDSLELGELLGGRKVESLATIGFVGPAGYARVLETYAGGRRRLPAVVVLMHGVSLCATDDEYARDGFERAVLAGTSNTEGGGIRSVPDRVFRAFAAGALEVPLPGVYGRFYGSADDFAAAAWSWHGSLIDPNRYDPAGAKAFRYQVSPAVARRLAIMGATMTRLGAPRVLAGVTPMPASETDEVSVQSRSEAEAELARRLGATGTLHLPASLPDDSFATHSHLSVTGRVVLTRALATEIERTGM